jgi:hypothetical protein
MNALAAVGLAVLTGAPIAAVFLFRHEERPGCMPPLKDAGPVTYPADEMPQERAPK